MRTRSTSDYSPTMKGSKEENQAVQARREMLKVFAGQDEPQYSKSKWARKMHKATGKVFN